MVAPSVDLASLYQPHILQKQLHDSDAKVKVLRWARRGGKSRSAYWDLLGTYLDSLEIKVPQSLVPPFHAWVVAPSYPQSRQVWTEIVSFTPPEFIAPGGIRQDDRMIYLKGSEGRPWGLLEVKSAHDPDTLQTAGLDYLWVTEAQDVSNRAFEKLAPTLRSPGRISKALYEGIPSLYRDHWFQRAFEAAETRDGWFSSTATYLDNPMLSETDRAEIEADREILPDRVFRRMYLAEFSEEAGYFRNISPCLAGDLLPEPIPGASYVAGLDLGRKMDASVFHIFDATERRVVFHATWDDGTNWVLQREHITRIARSWNISRLVVDATGMGGDIFTQELAEAGVPVEPFIITQQSREVLLQTLAVAMERETVHFPSVPSLMRQLRAFQFRKLPSGNFKAEAPPGEHDDEVFALALGLTACTDPPQIAAPIRSGYKSRYVPTQTEAETGGIPRSAGARMMRDRKIRRIEERAEKAGVT